MVKAPRDSHLVYDSALRGDIAIEEIREVFNFRHLIWQLIRRDILTRYKRSFLGIAWTMLNPLGMMIVWTIAFSQLFKGSSLPAYPAFTLNGLLAWTFFSQTTTAAMVNLVWGGNLLNRVYMPRSSFALAAMGTGMVNLLLSLIPLLLIMLINGLPLTWNLLFVPIPILILTAFSLGLGLIMSTFAVYFPDVSEMYQIIMQAWMFLTPIMYPETVLPEEYRNIVTMFNPMYHLVKLFRIPLYYGRLPTTFELLTPLTISIVVLIVGWIMFTRKSDEFSYRI